MATTLFTGDSALLKLELNGLVLTLSPTAATCTVVRDGQPLDFISDKPMDAAQGMARRANTLFISGRVNLLSIICGLLACGLPIKQAMLIAVNEQSGSKFQKLNAALTGAIEGREGQLRLLFQKLLEPRVHITIEPAARSVGPQRGQARPSV